MTCLKSRTENAFTWQICSSAFVLFTWLGKWPISLFIAAICWSNSFQRNQPSNGFVLFCFVLICFVLVLIIIVSGNLILGFWISEENKHFSWSYNGCWKGLTDGRRYFIFLLACKFFKKINQPKPNL